MSQSPVCSAQRIGPDTTTACRTENAYLAGRSKPACPRLSPLQSAAATAVIFTSLVLLGALTGVFSIHGNDEPVQLSTASTSPLRSAGGPVPHPTGLPRLDPADITTEIGTEAPSLRLSSSLPGAPSGSSVAAPPTDTARSGRLNVSANSGAVAPTPTQRTMRRAMPQQDHQRRTHQGKTREQVIEELMQAKRDGSYRALQESYR